MKEKEKLNDKKYSQEKNEKKCVFFYQIWLPFLTREYDLGLKKTV